MKVLGVIPARYGSTRFPGKALADINGKPMIQWCYESSLKSKLIDKLIVATDDKRIFDAVKRFGGEVVMTSRKHRSGTDRIAEAAKKFKCDIVVNIQGDEPFIDYRIIDKAIDALKKDRTVQVSTAARKITDKKEINNPNNVKVVFDDEFRALYFSRSAIPFNRDSLKNVSYYKHYGLYVYRKNYLMKITKMPESRLEKTEKLEQLRVLENGGKIKIVLTNKDSISIDTSEDLKGVKKWLS
ncbi:MAG TPA: 3-deoxy-manno-octulosonate cytidylyltransferase [Ignavibacteria bacterium]|nr:3-deoxy-manno-octulosonate cytidylyltransferase [Ignavibacteria bacterium]